MHATHDSDSADETRQDRRERYQTVLRTVDANTPTGGGIAPHTLRLILCAHANHDVEAIDRAVRAAVDNTDLVVWHDADGQRRLTPAAEDDLRALATRMAEEFQDQGQLARINQALAEVSGDE